MCGIAGYICRRDYDPRLHLVMTNMGVRMQERGRKSWGWTNGSEIIKSLGEFTDGWNYSYAGHRQAALHTRQPTTGSLIAENSHPFDIGNIIGMHNGMVANHSQLQQRYGRECKVDSEHIFHHINAGLSIADVDAYGAIVYWRKDRDAVFLGRFNNGQLTVARTADAWLFASTESAIRESLRFAGYNNYIIIKLKEDQLYRIENDDLYVDSPLKFGRYDRSLHGTWDNVRTGGTGTTSAYPTLRERQTGTTTSATATTNSTATGTASGTTKPEVAKTLTESIGIEHQIKAMVLATIAAKVKMEGVTLSQSSASQTATSPEVALTNWRCIKTQEVIKVGDPYYITRSFDFVSAGAAADMPANELYNTRPLIAQPIDIFKVQALLGSEEFPNVEALSTVECDECNEALTLEDTVVVMPDNGYLCVDCFAEGDGERTFLDSILDGSDDDSGDDDDEDGGPMSTRPWVRGDAYVANYSPGEPFYYVDDEHIIYTDMTGTTAVTDKRTGEIATYSNSSIVPVAVMNKILTTIEESYDHLTETQRNIPV